MIPSQDKGKRVIGFFFQSCHFDVEIANPKSWILLKQTVSVAFTGISILQENTHVS